MVVGKIEAAALFLTVKHICYRQFVTDVDYPVLDTEPIAVEFANTAYGVGADRTDFLETAELIGGWFALVAPGATPPRELGRVRALRDAVRAVLSAAVDGAAPDPAAVDTVNAAAAAAPTVLRLEWATAGPPTARRSGTAEGSTATLGRIAIDCVELVTDPYSTMLQSCASPDCSMLFVRRHRRRRFCHPTCGQRGRQARYYRRLLTRETA